MNGTLLEVQIIENKSQITKFKIYELYALIFYASFVL
jgi:hypothetical protein